MDDWVVQLQVRRCSSDKCDELAAHTSISWGPAPIGWGRDVPAPSGGCLRLLVFVSFRRPRPDFPSLRLFKTTRMSLALPVLLSARSLSSPAESEQSDSGFYSEHLRQSSPDTDEDAPSADELTRRNTGRLPTASSTGERCPQLTGACSFSRPPRARGLCASLTCSARRRVARAAPSSQHAHKGLGRRSRQGASSFSQREDRCHALNARPGRAGLQPHKVRRAAPWRTRDHPHGRGQGCDSAVRDGARAG